MKKEPRMLILPALLAALVFASPYSFRQDNAVPELPGETSAPPPYAVLAREPLPSPSPTPRPTQTPKPTPEPYEGETIARFALQFDGYDYSYGGRDPSTGFDCSGLVFYVYRQFGYRLNRVAADQARNGVAVETTEELLPGDILCFSPYEGAYINHVGIYIGDGQFIHAMDAQHDVLVMSLEEYLQTHALKMRRIVGCEQKLTLAEIERMERQEEALMAALEEERAKEAAEKAAQERAKAAAETPPPPTIPDPDASAREDAEKARQEEIAQAWAEILGDDPPDQAVPAVENGDAADPIQVEPEIEPSSGLSESDAPDAPLPDPPAEPKPESEPEPEPESETSPPDALIIIGG